MFKSVAVWTLCSCKCVTLVPECSASVVKQAPVLSQAPLCVLTVDAVSSIVLLLTSGRSLVSPAALVSRPAFSDHPSMLTIIVIGSVAYPVLCVLAAVLEEA